MSEILPPYHEDEYNDEPPLDEIAIGLSEGALGNVTIESQVSTHQRPDDALGDWELVAPKDRNIHQRIAEKTGGFVTAANVVSVAGGVLTAIGLHRFGKGKRVSGLAMAAGGRLLDLADGEIAKQTGTRSKIGAAVDAGVDKALVGLGAVKLARDGAVPAHYAALTGVQQVCIFAENALIEKSGGKPNPSQSGKHFMAAIWAAFAARSGEKILRQRGHEKSAKALGVIAVITETASLALGEQSIDGYRQQRKSLRQAKTT